MRLPRIHWSIFALILLGGHIYLARWMPLIPNLYRSRGWFSFAETRPDWLTYLFLLGLLYACYYGLIRSIRTQVWRPSLLLLVGVAIVLSLPSLLTYPFNANDLYRYAIRGKITAVYDGNPFENTPADYPEEPLLPLAGEWRDFTSPYGPLWELMAARVAKQAGADPLAHLIALKIVVLAAHIGIMLALWVYGSAERRAELAALWGLNPMLILVFGVDGHNDSWMLLWLVLGWIVAERALRDRSLTWVVAGLLILWLSPLTKAIGLLPIPFIAFYIFLQWPDWRGRWLIVGSTLLGWLALTGLMFLPFGNPLILVQRLVTEVTTGSSFSIITLAILAQSRYLGTVDITLFNRLFVWGVIGSGLVLAFLTWRGRSPLRAAADIFMAYILLAFSFRLWYASWSFPFVLLDREPSPWRLEAGLWFLLCSQMSVVFYGPYQKLVDDWFLSHRFGVPFTFALPVILALAGWGLTRVFRQGERLDSVSG